MKHILLNILVLISLKLNQTDSTPRKETSKYFLSEFMKNIETNNNNNNNNAKSNDLESNSNNNNNEKKSNYKNISIINRPLAETTTVEQPTKSYCRPNYKTFRVKISNQCHPFDYKIVECSGFCRSQAVVWKNSNAIQIVSCCSIQSVHQKLIKLYCLKPVEPTLLIKEFSKSSKEPELYEIFRDNFAESTWTDHFVYIGERVYAGYYSILMAYNVTCRCELILD